MFKNYFRTAWRNICGNKFYATINIGGLTIGLAVGVFLLLWVRDELSFDRAHKNEKNIYRIGIEGGTGISKQIFTHIIAPVAFFAKNELPEVQDGVRIMNIGDAPFKYKDKVFIENNFAFTDPSYFSVFDFGLIRGNPNNPFPDINSLVITESTARRYFGNEDPIGKVVTMGQDEQCKVTGVIRDYPENSSFQYKVLLPIARFNELGYVRRQTTYDGKTVVPSMNADWSNFGFATYLLLQPNADRAMIEKKLQAIHERNKPDDKPVPYIAQPLGRMHLYNMDGSDGGIAAVRMFAIVALLILVVACINYVNLSTARSMLRAKEVGMRKIVGAGRLQLFLQFMIETILLFAIAAVLAFFLIYLLLPYFNQLSGKQLVFHLWDKTVWWWILAVLLGTLAAASIYPALLLSSFKPLNVLKGKIMTHLGNRTFRRVLVVLQFSVSIILIVGTMIIGSQLSYIRNRSLGYDKEHIFSFGMRPEMQNHAGAVKNELLKNKAIVAVAGVGRDMVNGGSATGDNDWDGKPAKSNTWFSQVFADETTIGFFKMKLAEGKNFSGAVADSTHFLINETAMREMGLKDPIGKRLRIQTVNGTIIGVVKDFHFSSVHDKIEPAVFQFKPENCWRLYVKTTGADAAKAIAAAQAVWKQYSNDIPFRYEFLDDSYNKLYLKEQRQELIFSLFAAVAVFISCLGLLGLAAYTAQVKTKEIGIRKVLGAGAVRIVRLLATEFVLLVLIANVIAIPVALYVMTGWLNGFAYRTAITPGVFIYAGVCAVLVAMVTISYHAFRAAVSNPVNSLRTE
ncbi:ABC transporter permease [Niabella beijingensis]|uniref:ABC transporter permease n=1 Tax=Niabella beijingensis TaxID=2872700 RepID=UPI001CBC319C|nr:ABC transporter permease [Niabella beijingensis]MBZ4191475.1 ABC transporter permease [Niabella beijingensis]